MSTGYRDYTAKVLVVGDLILDRYLTGTVERMSPEFDDVPILRVEREILAAGGAANVAMNARALGAEVDIVGIAGIDGEYVQLSGILIQNGIDPNGVVTSKHGGTTTKTRLIKRYGNEEKEKHLVRIDRDISAEVALLEITRLQNRVNQRVKDKDVIICSDYGLGVINPVMMDSVRSHKNRSKCIVIVDPKSDDYSRYRGADIITPNVEETRMIIGRSFAIHDNSECKTAASNIYHRTKIPWVVLKRGCYGISLYGYLDQYYHYPAITDCPRDVCGAGDTAVAMLAVELARGSLITRATRRANIAAGLSVRKAKTAVVSMEEVDQWERSDRREQGYDPS